MKTFHQKLNFTPMLIALRQIQLWLESPNPPQVMLATHSVEDFEQQKLPLHCKVWPHQVKGPRVVVRGEKQMRDKPGISAYWPNDDMMEGVVPMLLFVLRGQADIRLSDYLVHCEEGDIIFVPAYFPKLDGSRPHYEKITPDSHCDLLFIYSHFAETWSLSASFCHSYGHKHSSANSGESCSLRDTNLNHLFAMLEDELQHHGQTKSVFYILAALITLFSDRVAAGVTYDNLNFPFDSTATYRQDPIKRALEYIQNHYNSGLSIDQVAHWVGLSRTAFTMRFRRETGQSFKAYISQFRLERAKELLEQSDEPIDRISEGVGLAPGQLRYLFQQKFGCSPRQYRKLGNDVQNQ